MSPLALISGMLVWGTENMFLLAVGAILAVAFVYLRNRTFTREEAGGSDMSRDSPDINVLLQTDRQKALDGLIALLNEIDDQVRDLDRVMANRAPAYVFVSEEANAIAEQFFYTCQVMEEQIKTSSASDLITPRQWILILQLKDAVDQMIRLSLQSDTLRHAIQGYLETVAAGGEI